MTTEINKQNNLKIEIKRWSIQFILIILAIPYGLLAVFFVVGLFSNFLGETACWFLSTIAYLLYYLLSVYLHFKVDKNYIFIKPWWKSNRVYSTLFLIITFISLLTLILNNILINAGIFTFLIFFIFCVVYTWMLSEYLIKKLKSDRNLAFNYPLWYSKRFILIIVAILLLISTSYAFSFEEFRFNDDGNNEYKGKSLINFMQLLSLILFFIYPFLILNFISELKNRSLNKNQLINHEN